MSFNEAESAAGPFLIKPYFLIPKPRFVNQNDWNQWLRSIQAGFNSNVYRKPNKVKVVTDNSGNINRIKSLIKVRNGVEYVYDLDEMKKRFDTMVGKLPPAEKNQPTILRMLSKYVASIFKYFDTVHLANKTKMNEMIRERIRNQHIKFLGGEQNAFDLLLEDELFLNKLKSINSGSGENITQNFINQRLAASYANKYATSIRNQMKIANAEREVVTSIKNMLTTMNRSTGSKLLTTTFNKLNSEIEKLNLNNPKRIEWNYKKLQIVRDIRGQFEQLLNDIIIARTKLDDPDVSKEEKRIIAHLIRFGPRIFVLNIFQFFTEKLNEINENNGLPPNTGSLDRINEHIARLKTSLGGYARKIPQLSRSIKDQINSLIRMVPRKALVTALARGMTSAGIAASMGGDSVNASRAGMVSAGVSLASNARRAFGNQGVEFLRSSFFPAAAAAAAGGAARNAAQAGSSRNLVLNGAAGPSALRVRRRATRNRNGNSSNSNEPAAQRAKNNSNQEGNN